VPLSWLPLGQVRASASTRAAALQSAKIEALTSPDGAVTYVTGGKQTKGALPLKTNVFDTAMYSSRGRGYARYNEDAATLFADEKGRIYTSVFDQAGGLGGRVRGAASEIAALRVFEAYRAIATANDGALDPAVAITDAMIKAHEQLLHRGEGEVTTAVAAFASPGAIVLVNSGDSGALHFDRQGKPRAMTTMHEHDSPLAIGCLTHALGLIPESPAPDVYRWTLEQGDWILLCTDGLLDAGLSGEEIGGYLASADSAEQAVNRICTRILRLMTTMRAKPDNLTVVAVHAL
jgi:serine/threonine protein phosphatase PrpC